MKYVVGIMLTAFGTFFTGEGIGVRWWQNDLSSFPSSRRMAWRQLCASFFSRRR